MPMSLLLSTAALCVVAAVGPGTQVRDVPTTPAEPSPVIAPGDGLGLAPPATRETPNSGRRGASLPVGGVGVSGAVLAVAVLGRGRKRSREKGGRGKGTAGEAIFVYVPGNGGDPDGFDDIAGRIGVRSDRVHIFDYRWAWASDDALDASRRARTGDAADALNAYVAALGEGGRRIYLVGHSKGGAVITEMIGRWDEHPDLGVQAVTGAMLLDPPIAAGPLGGLQSIGWFHPGIADDGLFDPIRCGIRGCRDVRVGLGERSGVEVVVVRNPDARLTNLIGHPDRLRIYDLDDGEGDVLARWPNVFAMARRMSEAHNSVLHSDAVAQCIAAEAKSSGSCRWSGAPGGHRAPVRRVRIRWGRGRSGTGPVMR